jgi:hypothetical protein
MLKRLFSSNRLALLAAAVMLFALGCESLPTESLSNTESSSASLSKETQNPVQASTIEPAPVVEIYVHGPIQAMQVRGPKTGTLVVRGTNVLEPIKFIVTVKTSLTDRYGKELTLYNFKVGDLVDAYGPPTTSGYTYATKIQKN